MDTENLLNMYLTSPQIFQITSQEVEKLISEMQAAELCRDLRLQKSLFAPFWVDPALDPNLQEFNEIESAFLLRYAGSFLCNYGRAQGYSDYQERGKNLLTRAIELFGNNNLIDEAYEAQIVLANAYWYEGAHQEFEAILEMIENAYLHNHNHPNYLLIQVNLIAYIPNNDLDRVISRIKNIKANIERCSNLKIKAQFHTNSGIIYRRKQLFETALVHFEQALVFANSLGSQRFISSIFNNIGNLYRSWGRYELAHIKVDEALAIAKPLGDVGWQANYLDTKASIYFDQEDFDNALDTINKAILFFPEGDDYAGYADALWLKAKILFKLDLRELGFDLFNKIIEIASHRIGEIAVNRYLSELANLAYFPSGTGYKEQVKNFKRFVLENALNESGGKLTLAAKNLNLIPQTMSDILRNQFPELLKDLDMKKERLQTKTSTKPVKNDEITSFVVSNKKLEFEVKFERKPYFFHFPAPITTKFFGKSEEIIIAVIPTELMEVNNIVLFRQNKSLRIGQLRDRGDWKIQDLETDDELNLGDVSVLGRIVGYCKTKNLKNDKVLFVNFK